MQCLFSKCFARFTEDANSMRLIGVISVDRRRKLGMPFQ